MGLRRLIAAIASLLFGRDVFLSYARFDGEAYATSLAVRLRKHRLTRRFDQWETQPGDHVPRALLIAARRARMLVIIATDASKQSRDVEKEIRVFRRNRPIVIIGRTTDVQRARWWRHVAGLPVTYDDAVRPGRRVLRRIAEARKAMRQEQRLQITGFSAVAALLLLIALAIMTTRNAQQAEQKAAERTVDALVNQDTAVMQRDKADRQRIYARAATFSAVIQTITADGRQRIADRNWAISQESLSRNMAAEARRAIPTDLDRALVLGAKAASIVPTPQARGALIDALAHGPRLQRFVAVHGSSVLATALSRDESLFAAGLVNGDLVVQETSSHRIVQCIRNVHLEGVTAVVFTRDGTLISGGVDGRIRFWNPRTGKETRPYLTESPLEINALAVNSDGTHLVVANAFSARTSLWNLEKRVRSVLDGSALMMPSGALSAAFNSDGTRIAIGYGTTMQTDGGVVVWDAVTGLPTRADWRNEWQVVSVAFSPDGRTVASMDSNETVQLWDAETGRPLLQKPVPVLDRGKAAGDVLKRSRALTFRSDGELACAGDGRIAVWQVSRSRDVASLEPIDTGELAVHRGVVRSLLWRADGRLLSAGSDGRVAEWSVAADAGTNQVRETIAGALAVDDTGSRIVCKKAGSLVVAALPSFRSIASISVELVGTPNAAAFAHHGEVVAVAFGYDIVVWDYGHKGEPVPLPLPPAERILPRSLFFDDGDERLVIVTDQAPTSVIVWNRRRKTIERVFALPDFFPSVYSAVLVSDHRTLYLASRDGIRRLDLGLLQMSRVIVPTPSRFFFSTLAGTADGRMLAAADQEGFSIWRTSDFSQLWRAKDPAKSLAFTANGRLLISAGFGIRAWDTDTGEMMATLAPDGPANFELAILLPNETLVVRDTIRRIRMWSLAFEDLISRARSRAGRELSDQERRVFLGETRVGGM